MSSRGIRVPRRHTGLEKLEEVEDDSTGYYVDPNIQYQEEDEIEAVLAHNRQEGRESDEKDLWCENVVSAYHFLDHCFCPFAILQRFHIKWKNFSHLHNTDETYEFLKCFRGLKRVDNYIKAYKAYLARLELPGLSSEDIEVLHLDKEHEKEELDTFRIVERIVAHRETAEATWSTFASGKASTTNIALGSCKKMLILSRKIKSLHRGTAKPKANSPTRASLIAGMDVLHSKGCTKIQSISLILAVNSRISN